MKVHVCACSTHGAIAPKLAQSPICHFDVTSRIDGGRGLRQ